MSDSPVRDEFLKIFDLNDFASTPYPLVALHLGRRRLFGPSLPWFWDEYAGEALQVGSPGKVKSKNLIVPPNMAAVVLMADGKQKVLLPGRHRLSRALNHVKPVSVQFINRQTRLLEFDELKIHTHEHLVLGLDLVAGVHVTDPELIIKIEDPRAMLQNALLQELVKALSRLAHEASVEQLVDLLNSQVLPGLDAFAGSRGMHIESLLVSHIHPDAVELNAAKARKERELTYLFNQRKYEFEMREAQAEEDVFAIKQPGLRRMIVGTINSQLRDQNQAARMEAIEAVSKTASALLEAFRAQPGRIYTPTDITALTEAIVLLKQLAVPVTAPPIPQQTRSDYAIDHLAPPPPERPALAVPSPDFPPDLPLGFPPKHPAQPA